MIQVTLQFSTLAAAIAALSALPAETLATLSATPQPTVGSGGTGNDHQRPATTGGPRTTPKDTPKPAAGPAADASTASSPKPDAEAVELNYEKDVKPLVLKLGGVKGRDAVAGVMKQLGVAKGPDLKPEQLANAKAVLEAALAA